MLQSIRDRLSGPIVWFVIGLICIPFAFWGIESFSNGSTDPIVAKVGDHEITQAEFRQGYEQRYQQLQQLLGENFNPGMIDQARFRQNVLDDMVQEQVLRQYAHDAGYRASDAAVFNYLSSVPAFQKDGKFSAQVYRDLLAGRGLQPQRFEGQLRESLVIDQLRESIAESAFVSDEEARLAQRIAGQTREVGMAVLPIARFQQDAKVSDEEVAARYESGKANYMAPERLKLAYIDLDLSKLPKGENPGADVLKVAYDAERDSRFTSGEERRASHILVSFGADKSAAKTKIEKLAADLKGGADFATLAKQNSDDTGSKPQGGDLGWVKRGMMTKSFEDALFGLKAGETSAPVETEFGWHLIKLDELKAPSARPFEDPTVQAELLEVYQQRELQKRFQEQTDKLEQLAFENPTSLEPVAQALGLKVETTDWFTRAGGTGIVAEAAIKEAAFSPEVLNDNENSKPLAVGGSRVVVIRKGEYEAPRQRPLAEVSDAIRAELKLAAARTQAAAQAQSLLAAVRKGDTLEAAAAAAGAELRADSKLARNGNVPERAVIDAAYKLPRPAEGKVSATEVALANGDLAVILLRKVEEPAVGATVAASDTAQLREAVAGAEFAAMRKSLEKEFKVEIKNPPTDADAAPAGADGG